MQTHGSWSRGWKWTGSKWLLACLALLLAAPPSEAKKKYSKEELRLAKPPKRKFYDWRLGRVYKAMRKQYTHIYHHYSSDGYIFPNERQELHFHLRMMKRIVIIDKRNKKVLKIYRRLKKKQRRLRRRRRRRRRRSQVRTLSASERSLLKDAIKHKKRYEKMIRRFACRYIKRYSRKYKSHCRKKR